MYKKWKLTSLVLGAAGLVAPVAIISSCSTEASNNLSLESIAKQATFSVEDKLKEDFASKVTINDLKWDQQDQFKDVQIKFENLTSNDGLGFISFDVTFNDGKNEEILIGKEIDGFKLDSGITINDQQVANEELQRLIDLNDNGKLINDQEFDQNQIALWIQSPNEFLKQIQDLKPNRYDYNINQLNLENNRSKKTISFDLVVGFRSGSANKTLKSTLNISDKPASKPPVSGNLSIIEAREEFRINYDWKLKQTSFSKREVDEITKNPNLILKYLDQFVYQQYFQYKVTDLKFLDKSLEFRINARFWRNEKPKILTSKLHKYQINTYDSTSNRLPAPINPTNTSWKIDLLNDGEVDIDFTKDSTKFDFNKLLVKNGKGEINFDDFPTRQFLIELIKANKLVDVKGELPIDWKWENYVDFTDQSEIQTGTTRDFSLVVFFDYVDSNNLDTSEILTLNLKNVSIDENKIKTLDYQKMFNEFKDHFVNQIKPNVQLSMEAITSGRNNVYQFANLDENNFLDFTNQDWPALIKTVNNMVRIQAKDVKIDYLNNQIKFKWSLIGLGQMDNNEWVDNSETTLKLESRNNVNKGDLNFNEYSNAKDFDLKNLHQFNINPAMIDRELLKEKMIRFNKNWTWMAREFITFLRFTFYQAFDDNFSNLAIAIVDKNGQDLPFNDLYKPYSNYKIVLKAKLDFGTVNQQTFLPFVQVFGTALNLTERTYKTGDIITMEVDVESILENPDPVQDATEILPGMGQGLTLGSGLGYQNTIEKWPPRFDIWRAQMGIFNFKISHNNDQLGSIRNIHRFISFNMMSLYNYQDLLWPEPQENGWVSGLFWM